MKRYKFKSTRFTRSEWFYTTADECLFKLSREELFVFRLILKGAP